MHAPNNIHSTWHQQEQQKITGTARKHGNGTWNEEKNWSIEAEPEMTETLQLIDEDFKSAIMNIIKDFKTYVYNEERNGHYKKEPSQISRTENENI